MMTKRVFRLTEAIRGYDPSEHWECACCGAVLAAGIGEARLAHHLPEAVIPCIDCGTEARLRQNPQQHGEQKTGGAKKEFAPPAARTGGETP